jgi:phospholipid/cholesterol/gamma-HCH transport system substrate-binding protein
MRSKLSTEMIVGLFVIGAMLIFAYMGFHIGAFRFDKRNYAEYIVIFNQISGLSRKAEVKIAGVKVGWVDSVKLEDEQVVLAVRVSKNQTLYKNAHCLIRQDGWFGPKFIDIDPGSDLLPALVEGDIIQERGKPHYDIDALLQTVHHVSNNIYDVTKTLKEVIGTPRAKEDLKEFVHNIHDASTHIVDLSGRLSEAISKNRQHLDTFLGMGTTVKNLAHNLETSVLPAFQESIGQIATVFDRDFNRIATQFDVLGGSFDTVGKKLSGSITKIDQIAEKINTGQGILGKLVNEDVLYQDLRATAQGFKKIVQTFDRLHFVFDSHFEAMSIPAENYHYNDSKGYFEVRLYPHEQFFYQFQLVISERGRIKRKETERTFVQKESQDLIDLQTVDPRVEEWLKDWYREQKLIFKREAILLGFQLGTHFKKLAIRFGIIEGYPGIGFDYTIGSSQDKFYWMTTFEAFDFTGFNRKHDRRPHLRWLNKIFCTQTIYFAFGADDFISKKNANIFFGGGIRFGDDDIRYVLGNTARPATT